LLLLNAFFCSALRAERKYLASAEERGNLVFYFEGRLVAENNPCDIEYFYEFGRKAEAVSVNGPA
jgi:hypothetical protein